MRPSISDALRRHPIARRLRLRFDAERLRADARRVPEELWHAHLGPYHDGRWESVSLWAPGGDAHEQRSIGAPMAATEALERCPYLREVLDTFPQPRSRVRLLRLRPGGRIFRHYDPVEQIASGLLRLHVPVVTAPEVRFVLAGRRIEMNAGEVWHLDVRFRHEVRNGSDRDRVHLVIDLVPGDDDGALMAGAEVVAWDWLTGYVALQWLPGRVRRWLRLAN